MRTCTTLILYIHIKKRTFITNDIASLALIKLFPLGQADPTLCSRLFPVTELAASNHLLKFAEQDPTSPTGELYYPLAENTCFGFWMVDQIRRQIILDEHAALSFMVKYATNRKQKGRSMRSVVKTIRASNELSDIVSYSLNYGFTTV